MRADLIECRIADEIERALVSSGIAHAAIVHVTRRGIEIECAESDWAKVLRAIDRVTCGADAAGSA